MAYSDDDFASALGIKSSKPSTGKASFDEALQQEGLLGSKKEHFFRSLFQQESSSGKNAKTSNAGAVGGMQIIPKTFASVADKDWDINDPMHNMRAGIRYANKMYDMAGGDEAVAGAGYYGGPNGLQKAMKGEAVKDPLNPNAPDTLQYGKQVADRSASMRDNDGFEKALFGTGAKEESKIEKAAEKDISKMSKTELFGEGLKISAKNTATGIAQILDPAAKYLEETFPEISKLSEKYGFANAKKAAEGREEEIKRNRAEQAPILATTAGQAGNITGDVAQAVMLPGGTLTKAVTSGAALGAAQPIVEGESRSANAIGSGVAGGVGHGVVSTLGALAKPVANSLSKAGQESVNILKKAGVPLDVAQETGSKIWQGAKRLASDNPLVSGSNQAFEQAQQSAYTKAIAKTMGEDAEQITPGVIQGAKNRLGDIYDNLFDRNGVRVTRSFSKDLNTLKQDAERVLPEGQKGISNIVDDILAKSKANMGHIDGKQYQAIKSQLDALEKQGGTSGHYAGELKQKLLDGLSDTVQKLGRHGDVALLKTTNRQWGNMRKIEDIALKDPEGFVSPSKLYNSLTTKGKRNAMYGENTELADLARAGKSILPEKVGDSGTAKRLAGQAAIPTTLAALDYAKNGDLAEAAQIAVGGYVAPRILAKLLTNQGKLGKYLKEGTSKAALKSLAFAPKQLGAGKIPTGAYVGNINKQEQ